ncbi:broad-complex core protein isoforms 1/2/3/4/5-like isoform X4 [Amphibalanus amphitrite]|uniref:broad-complex core protein isoforms 1/2/3/4/5-like isoform X4 n=1 Tax=Amphibalanus amphitrite TaxID=1232801 RepID=UPI001C91ACE0|nr:broad-complex core protein isoforms 1/2/3/4/5-like isoform X4 [Amphibalanus amphitrite]
MGKMAALQKFCLKWNNFQNSVTSVFENLRQDEELVDITLCCEGQKIKAHRMMLSACSPYFRDLLKENPCQHPVFFLKDTSYPDLAAVVEFVYKGEVNVLQSQLGSFLKTAEMLQVKGLSGDDDDDGPGRPTPTAVAASPAEPRGIEPRPRPASSPLRSRVREPPDCRPSSPRSKRRRLSGSDSRVGSQSPLPPVSSAPPPLPAAPLPPATIDLEPPPAAAALETPLDARPVAHQPPPPPPPPLAPHHSAQPHGDDGYNIKVEKVDIPDGDDDASLETALGQVSNMEASQFEGSDHSASSHDMAGLLSRLSEQGGSGDLSVGGAAGTSEDGSSQGLLGLPTWIGRQALPPGSGHTCNICGKTFTIKTSLIHHRSLHRGETACPFCQKVFSRKSNMMTHVRTVHAMAPGGELPPPLGPVTGGPPALQQ